MSDLQITYKQVTYLMLKRQGFIENVSEEGYEGLFRQMSPVPTLGWVEPGTAPEIGPRCDFDDRAANDFSRRMRTIVKGRFQGGRVGYVYQDELPLFAAVYEKPMKGYTEVEETILTLLRNEGPMNLKMMKEITGILNKHLAKAAQRLQKAFILYEDQLDNDYERAWFLLEDEFDHLNFQEWSKDKALEEIISRFITLNVTMTVDRLRSFTGLPIRTLKPVVLRLLEQGTIKECLLEDQVYYILAEDQEMIGSIDEDIPDDLYLLDGNDYIVRSRGIELDKTFGKSEYKTIQWLMVKGQIIGRLLGWFRFGPYDLEDIQLLDGYNEDDLLKGRILKAVEAAYDTEETRLKRYCGRDL